MPKLQDGNNQPFIATNYDPHETAPLSNIVDSNDFH